MLLMASQSQRSLWKKEGKDVSAGELSPFNLENVCRVQHVCELSMFKNDFDDFP